MMHAMGAPQTADGGGSGQRHGMGAADSDHAPGGCHTPGDSTNGQDFVVTIRPRYVPGTAPSPPYQ
jgi:hypothetical protein